MKIIITSRFDKILNEIFYQNKDLYDEVKSKVSDFQDLKNHQNLKVHKLHGKMKDYYSFSVNYKYRILFKYLDKNTVVLLTLGDHQIYQ